MLTIVEATEYHLNAINTLITTYVVFDGTHTLDDTKKLLEGISLVAVDNGVVVGFTRVPYIPENRVVVSDMLVVHPEFRGRGIGTALVKEKLRRLEGNHFTYTVSCWKHPTTTEGESSSSTIYQKLGFTKIFVAKNQWVDECHSKSDCIYRSNKCECEMEVWVKNFN